MKPPKHNPMLTELLTEDSLDVVRRRSLALGLAVARRRRHRANWTKSALISVVAICLFVWMWQGEFVRNRVSSQTSETKITTAVGQNAKNPAAVRFISDEELLALFPGRSLALIGPPGHKELVFLDQTALSDNNEAASKPQPQ